MININVKIKCFISIMTKNKYLVCDIFHFLYKNVCIISNSYIFYIYEGDIDIDAYLFLIELCITKLFSI